MTVFVGGCRDPRYPWEVYRAVILPASPLCHLLVCLGILMVDRPSANKLRRSMSSPPHFPAHHPPLLHAYTFSRAGSFVQARVPWTRSAPLLFACCQVTPLHPTALGNKRSCAHPTATWPSVIHQACTPPLHTIPHQPWVVLLLHNSLWLPHGLLWHALTICPLYPSPSPRDRTRARMPSSAGKKNKKFGELLSVCDNIQSSLKQREKL